MTVRDEEIRQLIAGLEKVATLWEEIQNRKIIMEIEQYLEKVKP